MATGYIQKAVTQTINIFKCVMHYHFNYILQVSIYIYILFVNVQTKVLLPFSVVSNTLVIP